MPRSGGTIVAQVRRIAAFLGSTPTKRFCRVADKRAKFSWHGTLPIKLDGPFLPTWKIGRRTTHICAVDCGIAVADHMYRLNANECRAGGAERFEVEHRPGNLTTIMTIPRLSGPARVRQSEGVLLNTCVANLQYHNGGILNEPLFDHI